MSKHPYNPEHPIGTCADCGGEMVYNVPRLGSKGGYVHKTTGYMLCDLRPQNVIIPRDGGAMESDAAYHARLIGEPGHCPSRNQGQGD